MVVLETFPAETSMRLEQLAGWFGFGFVFDAANFVQGTRPEKGPQHGMTQSFGPIFLVLKGLIKKGTDFPMSHCSRLPDISVKKFGFMIGQILSHRFSTKQSEISRERFE
jgi:hypothetical protein